MEPKPVEGKTSVLKSVAEGVKGCVMLPVELVGAFISAIVLARIAVKFYEDATGITAERQFRKSSKNK